MASAAITLGIEDDRKLLGLGYVIAGANRTNNRGELEGILTALVLLPKTWPQSIRTDSKWAADGVTAILEGDNPPNTYGDLWEQIAVQLENRPRFTILHIRAHLDTEGVNGGAIHEHYMIGNKDADQRAKIWCNKGAPPEVLVDSYNAQCADTIGRQLLYVDFLLERETTAPTTPPSAGMASAFNPMVPIMLKRGFIKRIPQKRLMLTPDVHVETVQQDITDILTIDSDNEWFSVNILIPTDWDTFTKRWDANIILTFCAYLKERRFTVASAADTKGRKGTNWALIALDLEASFKIDIPGPREVQSTTPTIAHKAKTLAAIWHRISKWVTNRHQLVTTGSVHPLFLLGLPPAA